MRLPVGPHEIDRFEGAGVAETLLRPLDRCCHPLRIPTRELPSCCRSQERAATR